MGDDDDGDDGEEVHALSKGTFDKVYVNALASLARTTTLT